MYQASKRLQAIRQHLKQMDKMYTCVADDKGQNEAGEFAEGSNYEWTDGVSLWDMGPRWRGLQSDIIIKK
jgi:hypothetical protein